MSSRKLIFEVKEEYERVRMRKRIVAPTSERRCAECDEEVNWLTIHEASAAMQVSPEELLTILDGDGLHIRVKPGGGLLICGNAVSGFGGLRLLPGK